MTRAYTWIALIGTTALYFALVLNLGSPSIVLLAVHFVRVALVTAVLVLYLPEIRTVFDQIPPPRRDYLITGIILNYLSAECFSLWNEAGRLFGVDTSIFTSPIAGFFSLLLVLSAIFLLIAPPELKRVTRRIAIGAGILVSAALVFVAPLFR